jgi:hypothetical protein
MKKATYREKGNGFYEVNERNDKGERLVFSIDGCTNPGGKNSLPYLWYKAGYTSKILETYLVLDTYVHDTEGACFRAYDPTVKVSDDGKRLVINFDWMLEDTEENRQKLINEMLKMFMSAKGKTATEIKMDKIYKYAKENGFEVLDKIPKGWKMTTRYDCPYGCSVLTNSKPYFKRVNGKLIKNPEHKEAILI